MADCGRAPYGKENTVSTDDASGITANDLGGADDMLSPMEATDSDDLRNADGDEVVDPPDGWSGVEKFGMSGEEQREGAPLDMRLAEEIPDVTPADIDLSFADDDAGADGRIKEPIAGSDLPPEDPGLHRGGVHGTPEDGESLFKVVE
jgi:hypothetical protein